MSKTRHTIRKLVPTRPAAFDEQLWPINVALVALGGVLAGFCISVFDFDDPRIHRNAVTWLALLPVLIGLAIWALGKVDSRVVRRAVLLSAVLSLIFNVGLMILMAWTTIFGPARLPHEQTLVENKPEPIETISDYVLPPIEPAERPQRDYEKPVETGVPDAAADEWARQANPSAEPEKHSAQPQPAPISIARTHLRPRRREMESAPRQSQHRSRLSRQLDRDPKPSAPAAASLAEQPPMQARPAQVEALATPIERQAAEVTLRQTTLDTEPATPRVAPSAQLARRQATRQPETQASATPTLRRKLDQPRQLPRTQVATESRPGMARQTKDEALRPSSTLTEKQLTATPQPTRQSASPETDAVRITSSPIRRQQRSQPSRQLARTPQPRLAKRLPVQSAPSVDRVDAVQQPTMSPSRSAPPELASSEANLAPQPAAVPTVQQRLAPADQLALSRKSAVNEPSLPRTTISEVPTIRPSAPTSELPARIRRETELAASPAPVSIPASAQTARSTRNPTAIASRTALTRSAGGTAGLGISPNLDRAVPAPSRPTQVAASVSMRRAEPVQRLPQGPAISPSAPARVSRSISDRNRPSASARAELAKVASQPSSREPKPLAANASAAVTRAAAAARSAEETASKGEGQIDFGPTRIASGSAAGRAAGGGQPVPNIQTQARLTARGASGGEPTLSIVAENVAPAAASPRGEGGGQPPSLAASPRSRPAARSPHDGRLAVPAGPTAPSQTGPLAARGAAALAGEVSIGRADMIDADLGVPRVGGGTVSRPRAALSKPVAANRQAETVSVVGGIPSSGTTTGRPLAADGTRPTRTAPGIPGDALQRPSGALAGIELADAVHVGPPDHGMAPRRVSPSDVDGPVVADIRNRGSPLELARRIGLPSAVASDAPAVSVAAPPASPRVEPDSRPPTGGSEPGPMVRQPAGSLLVENTAPVGPGGLGIDVAVDVGLPTRRAQLESEQIQPSPARFVRHEIGGPVRLNVTADLATDAFRRRSQRRGDPEGGGLGELSPQTEEAIELGLAFLARHQTARGNWSLDGFADGRPGYASESTSIRSDSAATGLSLLAFLGAGYHHKDYGYRQLVKSALDYLVRNQKPNGDLYVQQDGQSDRVAALYSHGIASIALCEAYGMTQDPELRQPAQAALDFIAQTQHPDRGGWRYTPGTSSDTSVTGWMMMALKSGQLANLSVPDLVYQRIEHWLDQAQASPTEQYLYCYNPYAPDTDQQRHGRRPSNTMTSVGLLMRLYLGWRRDDPRMIQGASHLLRNLPQLGTPRNNRRDTYYWYYATQVMFHMGGPYWEAWNGQLHPLLLDTQLKEGPMAGSWNPRLPVPDRWGPHAGRIYVTTMNLLSLEVYYRHLPIYEETAR